MGRKGPVTCSGPYADTRRIVDADSPIVARFDDPGATPRGMPVGPFHSAMEATSPSDEMQKAA